MFATFFNFILRSLTLLSKVFLSPNSRFNFGNFFLFFDMALIPIFVKYNTKTAKKYTVCQLKAWYTRPLCNQGLWHPQVFFTLTTDVIFAL